MFAIHRQHPDARLPTQGSKLSAGYDLYSVEEAVIGARQRALIDTGIRVSLPADCYARIAPRSGLSWKHGIDVMAGVIDADFRDTIKVVLINLGDKPFHVDKGDRIAQLILERIYLGLQPTEVDTLDITERGEGGFGSTD